MISSIHLEHFKCFTDLRLPLAPLTLLTGVNAAGKSSAIQPLVLLHQTMMDSEHSKSLVLNGLLLRLGRFVDVVDEVYGRDSFAFKVVANGTSIRWLFRSASRELLVGNGAERAATVDGRQLEDANWGGGFFPRWSDPTGGQSQGLAGIERWLAGLIYLSTERIGPRDAYRAASDFSDSRSASYYPVPSEMESTGSGFNERVQLGSGGELTPWYLLQYGGDRQVHKTLCLDATTTLARQVEARLADFFPGAGLDLKPVSANFVTLLIRTDRSGRFHLPQNVGFGLTNILPVLTACLAASPGQPVIIENPEGHLHPSAQAKMGRFVAQVAATGVQVILESHSDHILNGIRRAVKEGVVPPESVAIHFFQRRESTSGYETQVVSPVINKSGVLDYWPPGFFDQLDRDLEALTDWGGVS